MKRKRVKYSKQFVYVSSLDLCFFNLRKTLPLADSPLHSVYLSLYYSRLHLQQMPLLRALILSSVRLARNVLLTKIFGHLRREAYKVITGHGGLRLYCTTHLYVP